MVDFWEIMGRMVMDVNFRNDLFTFPARNYAVAANLANIPSADYTEIRTKVRNVMPNKPLSLMALGELLYGLSFSVFRTNATTLAAHLTALNLPAPQSANGGFYIGLGAMILDTPMRTQLVNLQAWQTWGLLSIVDDAQDRATLTRIMDPNQTQLITDDARDFCKTLWDQGCNDRLIEWAGHEHPATPITL